MTGEAISPVLGGTYKPSFSMARAAKLSAVSTCPTALTSAVAGVDAALLVEGTSFHDPARVPAAARGRGAALERVLRDNEYAHLIRLARLHFGYDVAAVIPANLRMGFPPNRAGLVRRARETRRHIERWLRGDADAANFLDGAVIEYSIGSRTVYAEADVIGLVVGDALRLFEIKAKQLVDGTMVGGVNRGWKLQMTLYLVLLRNLINNIAGELAQRGIAVPFGGDPAALVSTDALLVLSDGIGLYPTGIPLDLKTDIEMAELMLERLDAFDDEAALGRLDERLWPANLPVAHDEASAEVRAQLVGEMIDTIGHDFGPQCMGNCELYRLCRERNAGRVATVDRTLVRVAGSELPTFEQVVAVSRHPTSAPAAAGAQAEALSRAANLVDLAATLEPAAPRARGRATA